MKSARPILYGIIGFIVGAIAGILVLGWLSPNPDSGGSVLFFAFSIGGGALGAIALGLLGRKLSKLQEAAEQRHGYFWLLNVLITVLVITSLVISFILGIIYYMVPSVGANSIIVFILTAASNVLSAWFAVWYVARKGYLQPDHDPARIAGITVGVFLGLALILGSLVFILPQGVASGIMANIGIGAYIQWAIGLALIYASVYFFTSRAQAARPQNVLTTPT